MKKILYFVVALSVVAISCTVNKPESVECVTVNAAEIINSLGLDSVQVDTIMVNE